MKILYLLFAFSYNGWISCWTVSFLIYMRFFTYAESPLTKRVSQTVDIKPKVKEPSPKDPDIKPKMLLPKKEPKGLKTEPKEEVEEDVKHKELFIVSGVNKGDLMEQLAAKNKHLAEQIAKKNQQIADQANQVAEQAKQLTEKDKQIVKYQQMYEELMQG